MIDMDVLRQVLQLPIGIAQAANRRMFDLLGSVVPLNVLSYPSGREHNGWVVPCDWVVRKAAVRKDGRIVFDGTIHPLAVAGYSSPFRGTVSKTELDRHVFFSRAFPDAYAFHCMNNYRPWEKHWGFCIPHAVYAAWPEGSYEVDLDVEFKASEMLAGEILHRGQCDDTIVFNAHTCHPCQANDDMSGVMVILELFRWLAKSRTRYSYLGVLAPEHVGTVFYTAGLPASRLEEIKLGCFVEMAGSNTPLVLQESFFGDSIIDRVGKHVLKKRDPAARTVPFRAVVGNDETVWEAPGVEIPMITVCRAPYPEYHTSRDDIGILSAGRLEETLDILKDLVSILENDVTVHRRYRGLVALSNPKYSLYIERPDPVVRKNLTPRDLRLGAVQDILPRYFNGTMTAFEMAEMFGIPQDELMAYLNRYQEKELVELRMPDGLNHYRRNGFPHKRPSAHPDVAR